MSGAPIGEAMTVTVDGEERTYHIKPNVFSDATLDALSRLHKSLSKERRKEALLELSQLKQHIDQGTFAELQAEVIKNFVTPDFGGYLDAVEMLKTRDGMAIALQMNCDEISTRKDALELIKSTDSVVELFEMLFSAGNEAIMAAKNSSLPRAEEETASV